MNSDDNSIQFPSGDKLTINEDTKEILFSLGDSTLTVGSDIPDPSDTVNFTEAKLKQQTPNTWAILEVIRTLQLMGEANVIDEIKVNGIAQVPAEKTVDISVPTDIGDLADAQDLLGDKNIIEVIKVNDVTISVTDKTVNIPLAETSVDFTAYKNAYNLKHREILNGGFEEGNLVG